jgi:hypothetical protein
MGRLLVLFVVGHSKPSLRPSVLSSRAGAPRSTGIEGNESAIEIKFLDKSHAAAMTALRRGLAWEPWIEPKVDEI